MLSLPQMAARSMRKRLRRPLEDWLKLRRARGPLCFVGDVHGHLDKLETLWDKLPAAVGGEDVFEKMTVTFLGDYCDKGPDTAGVIEWMTKLQERHPEQKHIWLCGNHDFALSAFLGLLDLRTTPTDMAFDPNAREAFMAKLPGENMYKGPGHETMHLQGVRYAAEPKSVYESHATFASYGVPYGDREGLLKAMPTSHQEFLRNLEWIAEIGSGVGHVIAVHAGLEECTGEAELGQVIEWLRERNEAVASQPFIEPLSGRSNVERMPSSLRPYFPDREYAQPINPPYFLISGHHGFVRVAGRRIVLDMCGGKAERDLAAMIISRDRAGMTFNSFSDEQGVRQKIVTSRISS
ncbi:Serine/threonine-protein phosphatase PP2A catalytic subunit [Hondaea fermentalgiana]|uniref:Serine/threonine-protein phosphatase PP2A catalytic subunit n=1 Tax=Hondaea fermentalgiana TaxID=2315210 RepID=A0A2R5G480_9STRA|nr:Serine/threonine-protein phosphatase PP2A catalytic subunit [Hondaea fermentalgiana]|eukprot:GBG24588.1 Serine/threonine-protein phosphatase PP2A catalytic subunit [Hondaea fermentalgiana]